MKDIPEIFCELNSLSIGKQAQRTLVRERVQSMKITESNSQNIKGI